MDGWTKRAVWEAFCCRLILVGVGLVGVGCVYVVVRGGTWWIVAGAWTLWWLSVGRRFASSPSAGVPPC